MNKQREEMIVWEKLIYREGATGGGEVTGALKGGNLGI